MSDRQSEALAASPGMSARKNLVLLVLCAQLFLDSMDVSLMGVALPEMQDDMGLSAEQLQWVISGYAVAYGGSCSWAAGRPTCSDGAGSSSGPRRCSPS